jgi:2-dehydro-3-deoxygluconokinase
MSALGAIGEGLAELSVAGDGSEVALAAGGDVANVCVMAARMGAVARLAGRIGDDALGARLELFWQQAGVDVRFLRRDRGAPTGLYVNERALDLSHRFTYWRAGSAGSRLQPSDVDDAFFVDLGVVVVSGITLAVSSTSAATADDGVARAARRGAQVCCVLNHRPALGGDVRRLAAVASASDILIGSAEDVEGVFGGFDREALVRLGPREIVISDRDQPVWAGIGGEELVAPVPRVAVRNAAGAGDALAGAYLAARLEGRAPAIALTWGVAAASLSVQRDGCAASYPSGERTRAEAQRSTAGVSAGGGARTSRVAGLTAGKRAGT